MIPNITTGVASAFQATARYDLNPEKGYLLKTNCASQDADGIAREMEVQSSSSRTKQPMFHMSVRLPPGESLDDEKWAAVGEGLLNKMGINTDNHMYLITRHTDIKDGDHIHLLASKVDENGKSWNGWQSMQRAQDACRELEREFGLTQLKDHQLKADGKMNTIKAKLHESIAEAKASGGSIDNLKAALEKRGLELKVHQQSTGRIQGASISDKESGKTWKMSELYGGKGGFKGVQNELAGKDFEIKKDIKPKHAKPNSQLTRLMMNPTALLNPMSLIKAAMKPKLKVLEL